MSSISLFHSSLDKEHSNKLSLDDNKSWYRSLLAKKPAIFVGYKNENILYPLSYITVSVALITKKRMRITLLKHA